MSTFQLAQLMFRLFHGRRDAWGVRRGQQYFKASGKQITVDDYHNHINGKTIGIYPILESGQTCLCAAMDIDLPDLELARAVSDMLPQPNYIERSRSGHYHIWMFFEKAILVDTLSVACSEVLSALKREADAHCQLYPLKAGDLGLLIALPFQQEAVAQGNTIFIDAASDLDSQRKFLAKIKYTKPPKSFMDDKKLADLWNGVGKKSGDKSGSGYDFSFALALAQKGYSRPTIKTLLVARPGAHSTDADYIDKTVDSACASAAKHVEQKKSTAVELPSKSWDDIEALTREEMLERLKKYLILYDEQVQQLDIFFATIIANLKTKGRPVWLLFVGPPGCGKTLPMMAVQYAPCMHMASAFRPASLISGWGMKGGEDMSLIPKLNGKILLVKDLSSLLSQHREVVAEVLGLLRDAYDGSCSKVFGTGVERTYESRFGFIGATTPDIDAHWSLNVRLGERFLRYRCRTKPSQLYEKIERTLSSLDEEEANDLAIEDACLGFLKYLLQPSSNGEEQKLFLSKATVIGRLAQLGAILRTVVARNPYGHEVLVIPEWEEGTRYAKQLAKIAVGLAAVRDKKTNDAEELNDLKALVRDSMDARVEKICAALYARQGQDASEIAEKICLPSFTVRSCLDDLAVARVVYHQRDNFKLKWFFVPWIEGQIREFGLWKEEKSPE